MAGKLCVFLLVVPLLARATDMTRKEKTAGPAIVEAVIDLIQRSCIFDEDKVFMRRLAYVESNDGLNPKTFRTNYYGGIWQVDRSTFNVIKWAATSSYLRTPVNEIIKHFKIDFKRIRWEDLLKPLYSGLAARLHILYQWKRYRRPLPRPLEQQASFWSRYYRRGGDVKNFVKLAKLLEKGCTNTGSDITLLLDDSGSVGGRNFLQIKKFAKSLVNSFEIGRDKNQFSIIKFSSSATVEFYLNRYRTKAEILRAIDRILYRGGGTRTDLALDRMTNEVFTTRRGARDPEKGVPHVGIVLTDGRSTKRSLTVMAALRAHAKDINMFSVGITRSIDMNELRVIASEPDCLHVYVLKDFSEVDSLKDTIERRTCRAPIIIDGKDSNEINGKIPGGREINCKIKIPRSGTTIKLDPHTGSVIYYIATKTFPSSAYYDRKVVGTKDRMGVMYIPFPRNVTGSEYILFCNIKGDNRTDTNVTINIRPGDRDWCRRKPCRNGECVDLGRRGYMCECFAGWTGRNCEININECKSNPCRNQGTCIDGINRYICRCKPGFTGRHCETSIDNCRSRPCQNNAQCVSHANGYRCICRAGFTGKHCENRINYCVPNPCRNGGQCINRATDYWCKCRTGFTGRNCETSQNNGYDCTNNNPCTPANIARGRFYHPHTTRDHFVQCAPDGRCWVMPCAPGTVWSQNHLTCVHAR